MESLLVNSINIQSNPQHQNEHIRKLHVESLSSCCGQEPRLAKILFITSHQQEKNHGPQFLYPFSYRAKERHHCMSSSHTLPHFDFPSCLPTLVELRNRAGPFLLQMFNFIQPKFQIEFHQELYIKHLLPLQILRELYHFS